MLGKIKVLRFTVTIIYLVLTIAVSGNGQSQVVQFPGQAPGKTQVKVTDEQICFENNVLSCSWAVSDGHLLPVEFTDKISSTKLNLKDSQCFKIIDANEQKINCSDLKIVGKPTTITLEPNLKSAQLAEHFAGKAVSVELASTDGRLKVNWTAILRDESNYIHQLITFRATKRQIPVKSIVLVDIPCGDARVVGTASGSPAVCGNMFFAYEHPGSQSQIVKAASKNSQSRVVCRLTRNAPLKPDKLLSQLSVFGVVPAGQLRRGFLYYVERQRAHPYRPFLHYNSWWDISWHELKINEKQCLDVIDYYGKELTEKRGVEMDSLVFDDGWDDNTTLWQISKSNFPNGFTPLTKLAQKYNSQIGLWISPWGGYHEAQKQRLKYGEKQGFEINECAYSFGGGRDYRGFSLAGKKYYKHFEQRCLDMMVEYNVNFFKFDGTTTEMFEETEAMLRLCGELRKVDPNLYISITAGTWASAFWLMYGDNTWRGGHDMSYCGKGTKREQWITYRDRITYENFVQKGPLYPLNSLMICGIINAPKGPPNRMTPSGEDFIHEIRSFFATGTNLQELYVKPARLTQRAWDVLAESVKWSRANSDVLVDNHWVGGNPGKLDVYGWAGWSKDKAILSLRNPSDQPGQISIDIEKAFELPSKAPRTYSLKSPWRQDADKPSITLTAGVEHTFRLEPFEVLVFDASPRLCAKDYYVSPTGDDNNNGTQKAPFRTIQRAADLMKPADVCYVAKGEYKQSVVPKRSGVADNYITFIAETSDVLINLGRRITNWQLHSKNIYKAKVNWRFDRLFVDGCWMPSARYPNGTVDPMYPVCEIATADSHDSAFLTDSCLRQPDGYWTGATIWVTPGDEWVTYQSEIKTFTQSTGKLTFDEYASKSHYHIKTGNRYYIYNKFEELDSPGEWYLDGDSNTVYLWPPDGDNPNNHIIESSNPDMKSLAFTLDGLGYIKVKGFNIFDGTISLKNAHHCIVEDCKMLWGGKGLYITGEHNKVRNCEVAYTPRYGVRIYGSGNLLEDCEVHHCGYFICGHSLVDVAGTFNTVSGCKVHHGGKDGITWDRAGKGGGNCLITGNEVYEPTTICSDCGCFYTWGRDGNDTVVSYNKFHDNDPPGTIGWGGSGLYLDNNSRNFICHHNICYNNSAIGIQLNLPSINNKIYNNVSYNNKYALLVGPSGNRSMADTHIKNNIFFNNNDNWCADLAIGNPEPYPVLENNCYHNRFNPGKTNTPGTEPSAVIGNPVFVDTAAYDFRLHRESPCIDKGKIIEGVTDRFAGSAPDIGAYEFGKNAAASNGYTVRQLRQERRQAAHKRRRIIYDNDGCDAFCFAKEATAQSLLEERAIPHLKSQVDSVFYCTTVSMGLYSHNSRAGEVFTVPFFETGRNITAGLIEQGTDALKIMIEFYRKHNTEIFANVRMNDIHDAGAYYLGQTPKWKWEHPEWLFGSVRKDPQAAAKELADSPYKKYLMEPYKDYVVDKNPPHGRWSGADFTVPQVRDLEFNVIEELCNNYDIDGIYLDFRRHCPYFKTVAWGEPVTAAQRDMMTELMRRIRQMTEQVGLERRKPVLISVRVLESVQANAAQGLDVEQWLRDDLVDMMVAGQYWWQEMTTLGHCYDKPVYAELKRERVNGLPGERARAMNAWNAGVDGIFMFNYFDPKWLPLFEQVGEPQTLRKLEKIYVTLPINLEYLGLSEKNNPGISGFHIDAPKVLQPGEKVLIPYFPVGEDVLWGAEQGIMPVLKLHIQALYLEDTRHLNVLMNNQPLTDGNLRKVKWWRYLEFVPKPELIRCGNNRFEITLSEKSKQTVKLFEVKLQVKYEKINQTAATYQNPLNIPLADPFVLFKF